MGTLLIYINSQSKFTIQIYSIFVIYKFRIVIVKSMYQNANALIY